MADRFTVVMTAPVSVSAKAAGVVHDGVVDTNRENCLSTLAMDDVPVAVTVKVYDPAVEGVPVRPPPLDRARPVGKLEPAFTT